MANEWKAHVNIQVLEALLDYFINRLKLVSQLLFLKYVGDASFFVMEIW